MSQSQIMCVLPVNVAASSKYCCVLQNQLKKDLKQLQQESQRIQLLETKSSNKLESFLVVSKSVDNKLCHLWSLADQIRTFDYSKGMQVYGFANRMSEAWRDGDEVIAQDVQSVQIVSCTTSNVPLSYVIEKVQANVNQAWEEMQNPSCRSDCTGLLTDLYNKITALISRLLEGNQILRYFLSICKAIPYLKDLETVIDRYTENISQYMSMQTCQGKCINLSNSKCKEDLSAIPKVVQLLTGEILGQENFLDHRSKIEPIVRHEMPEIPKSAFVNPFPRPVTPQWNYANSSPTNTVTSDNAIRKAKVFYPVILQDSSNRYETPGVGKPARDRPWHNELKMTSRLQKWTPENRGYRRNDAPLNDRNVVSVLLLEHTGGGAENNLDARRVENVIRLVDRSNMRNIPLSRKRSFTRRARSNTVATQDTSDLAPIKIPSLKQNLLVPLCED